MWDEREENGENKERQKVRGERNLDGRKSERIRM